MIITIQKEEILIYLIYLSGTDKDPPSVNYPDGCKRRAKPKQEAKASANHLGHLPLVFLPPGNRMLTQEPVPR